MLRAAFASKVTFRYKSQPPVWATTVAGPAMVDHLRGSPSGPWTPPDRGFRSGVTASAATTRHAHQVVTSGGAVSVMAARASAIENRWGVIGQYKVMRCQPRFRKPRRTGMNSRRNLIAAVCVALVACSDPVEVEPAPAVTSATSGPTVAPTAATAEPNPTATTSASTTSTGSPPFTGYADFGGLDYFEVDPYVMVEAWVRCMNDHGIPATIDPPGDGIGFARVPDEKQPLLALVDEACHAGLNMPDSVWPTPYDMMVKAYFYQLALKTCMEVEGYVIPDPPTLAAYVDSWMDGPYSPYAEVGEEASWDSVDVRCPQSPPGGWASWEPGMPIKPIPEQHRCPPNLAVMRLCVP